MLAGIAFDSVPRQVEARQLFRPAGLASALKIMQRELPGRITNLSIRRDRINASIFRAGASSFVNFAADAEVPDVLSRQPGASLTPNSLSYSDIDSKAPARLIRAAGARLGKAPNEVDYLVVSKFAGTVQWGRLLQGRRDRPG